MSYSVSGSGVAYAGPLLTTALLLFATAAVAGYVDAIAGGGGLLTLPALLSAGVPAEAALATNKGQSAFGSGVALLKFARSPLLDRRRAAVSFVPALIASALGVWAVTRLSPDVLKPLVIVMLAGVALFMLAYKPPSVDAPPRPRSAWLAVAVAVVIAFYDGFFGPGTGTFLILAYALLWRDPLHAASANAKAVNFASNLAALVAFASAGSILWRLALPMAAGQLIGGYLGAHATIRRGRGLVRVVAVVVSLALLGRLVWQMVTS